MCFTLLTSNRPARHSQCGVTQIHFHTAMLNALSQDVFAGSRLALRRSHVEISRRLRARKASWLRSHHGTADLHVHPV